MRSLTWVALLILAFGGAGCGSFNGPGIDYTAPRVTGRVVDDNSGQPVRYARVGRKLWSWRQGTGGFLRGGEEKMVQMQDYARTDADGAFTLPSKQVALLFSFGEVGLNLGLAVQHSRYAPWQTNFPLAALATNTPTLQINAGEVRLRSR